MFVNAHSFNQPLNKWDVSNVTKMYCMFKNATSLGHFLYRSIKAKNSRDPLSSDTTVRLVLRLGCGGARALRDSGRSLEHDEKAQPAH